MADSATVAKADNPQIQDSGKTDYLQWFRPGVDERWAFLLLWPARKKKKRPAIFNLTLTQLLPSRVTALYRDQSIAFSALHWQEKHRSPAEPMEADQEGGFGIIPKRGEISVRRWTSRPPEMEEVQRRGCWNLGSDSGSTWWHHYIVDATEPHVYCPIWVFQNYFQGGYLGVSVLTNATQANKKETFLAMRDKKDRITEGFDELSVYLKESEAFSSIHSTDEMRITRAELFIMIVDYLEKLTVYCDAWLLGILYLTSSTTYLVCIVADL